MSVATLPPAPVAVMDAELVSASDPRASVVSVNPARVSGTPCFRGTRVPLRTLWDHLQAGDPLETFLSDFPAVTREQAEAALCLSLDTLLAGLPRP